MTKEELNEERLNLGRTLAQMRVSHGMTVRGLGEASGVTWQNITKFEHGKYNPSVDILNKLGSVLGFRVSLVPDED